MNYIRTDGFYYYKKKGKNKTGEYVEINYIVNVQMVPNPSEELTHLAYVRAIQDSNEPNFQNLSENDENREQAFCVINNNWIKFKINNGFIESLKWGSLLLFEGAIQEGYLLLTHSIKTHDLLGNLRNHVIIDSGKFNFYPVI